MRAKKKEKKKSKALIFSVKRDIYKNLKKKPENLIYK